MTKVEEKEEAGRMGGRTPARGGGGRGKKSKENVA